MKQFCRLLAALAVLCHPGWLSAQSSSSTIEIVESFPNSGKLEKSVYKAMKLLSPHAATGLLADRSFLRIRPMTYSRNIMHDSTRINYSTFAYLYTALDMAAVDDQHRLPDPADSYMPFFDVSFGRSTIPLIGLLYQYDYIIDDATVPGSMHWSSDTVLIPDIPVSQILRRDTILAICPQTRVLDTTAVYFTFPIMTTNIDTSSSILQIDLGEGGGWQSMSLPGTWCTFSSSGKKHISLRWDDGSGYYRYTHFSLQVNGFQPNPYNDEIETRDDPTTYDQTHPVVKDIVAEQNYEEKPGKLRLFTFYHCADKKIRKPLILCDGFEAKDTGNSIQFPDAFKDDKLGLINHPYKPLPAYQVLFDQGYDLIFVDWLDDYEGGVMDIYGQAHPTTRIIRRGGQDYIQRNAYALETALKYINEQKAHAGSVEKNQVIGMSMGGVVWKWALLDMEQRGLTHDVETFVAYDSPLRGANIAIGLQEAIKDLRDYKIAGKRIGDKMPILDKKAEILSSPFARQMLILNSFRSEKDSSFINMENDFNTKGINGDGSFSNLRFVALSNGSISGIGQLISAGDKIAEINTSSWDVFDDEIDKEFTDGIPNFLQSFTTYVLFGGIGFYFEIVCDIYSLKSSGTSTVYTRSFGEKLFGIIIKDSPHTTYVRNSVAYDTQPGSFTSLGSDVSSIQWKVSGMQFIPMVSSLDYKGDINSHLYDDLSNKENVLSQGLIRPDAYEGNTTEAVESFEYFINEAGNEDIRTFPPQENQLHVFNYNKLMTFAFYYLLQGEDILSGLTTLNNQKYNYGINTNNNPSITPFLPASTPKTLSKSLTLENSSELMVNKAGEIGLIDGDGTPQNSENSYFSLGIYGGGCTPYKVVLNINSGCKFLLGDSGINNKSQVIIGEGNEVYLRSGSELILENSEINIKKSAKLVIEDQVLFKLLNGSKITVDSGGYLYIGSNSLSQITGGSHITINGIMETDTTIISNMNGFFFIKEDGRWLVNGDLTLSGIDREQEIIRLEDNASCLFDVVNVAISQGKIQSVLTSNDGFTFEKGASNVTFSNVVFQYGSPISIAGNLNGVFSAANCDYNDVSKSAYINGLGSSFTGYQVVVSDCKVFNSATPNTGFIIQNIKNVNVTNSEFYSDKPTWSSIYSNGGYGLDLQTVERLDLTSCHFAKLNTGITNNSADVRMQCTYFINCIYGAVTGSFFENTDFIMNQSGMIGNRLGAQLSLTNLDINTPAPEWYLGNIYSDCCYPTETMLFIPDKYQKNPERDSNLVNNPGVGGRDIPGPQLPECGYIFRGTVVNTPNPMTGMIPAEYNYWYDGPLWTCTSNKSDLQLVPSGATISLNTEPENTIGDMRDITTCTWILNPRSPESSKSTKSDVLSQLYLVPNPASDQLIFSCQDRFTGWLSLKDISGNEVLKKQVNESTRVNISGLIPGIYFAHINDVSNNIIVDQKIIIVR